VQKALKTDALALVKLCKVMDIGAIKIWLTNCWNKAVKERLRDSEYVSSQHFNITSIK